MTSTKRGRAIMSDDFDASSITSRRKMLILAICCLSIFIVGMDLTNVNIALPTIQQNLNTGIPGLQ
jgi:hypothetical protein